MRCSGMLLCALALQMGAARAHDERDAQARRPQWTSATSAPYTTPGPITLGVVEACHEDAACLTIAAQDRAGLEAITQLHRQLDDDANGNVDLSESDDFLREELQYDSGYEKRQRAFHHNDDMHISVRELWEAWLRSEVHNWTVEQTVEWLTASVDLPQYKTTFLQHKVIGATLPRLAVNNMQYMSNVLGIKDPIHKQKLALKAMDVVLFGPPKEGSRWKDWLLACLILGAVFGGWAALRARRRSRTQLQRMLRDMEQLRRAEVALDDMQKELEKARLEQESVTTEKRNLEKRLREAGDTPALTGASSDLEVSQLKQEIEMLRAELRRAEGELEDRCWAPPLGLQQWLQLTHEVENRSYMRKKQQADMQLQQAREACEKLKKKRSSLVGAFVSTHGKSIDDVDRSIVEARTALNEVTVELQERVHRWKQIEMLCGFNIINNNGLQYLESALYRTANGRPGRVRVSSSQDDLSVGDEAASLAGRRKHQCMESVSPGTDCLRGGADSLMWREDSSGSETPEPPHYPLDLRLAEARHQLEERLAQEARDMKRSDERRGLEERRLTTEALRAYEDRRLEERRGAEDRKMAACDSWSERGSGGGGRSERRPEVRKSPGDGREGGGGGGVQFVLGGENLNWPAGDDVTRATLHSQSQPQLRASMRVTPLPPPRRPHSNIAVPMVRSRSSDIMMPSVDEPRAPPRHPIFTKQKTLAEETGSISDTQTAGSTPPEEESTDSSLMEEDTTSKPRRRKLHFPFAKKAKGLPA